MGKCHTVINWLFWPSITQQYCLYIHAPNVILSSTDYFDRRSHTQPPLLPIYTRSLQVSRASCCMILSATHSTYSSLISSNTQNGGGAEEHAGHGSLLRLRARAAAEEGQRPLRLRLRNSGLHDLHPPRIRYNTVHPHTCHIISYHIDRSTTYKLIRPCTPVRGRGRVFNPLSLLL